MFGVAVGLQLFQDLCAAHIRQIEIEKNQHWRLPHRRQMGQGGSSVLEMQDFVINPGTPDIFLDQAGVTRIIFN
jgi:hypothetical protein